MSYLTKIDGCPDSSSALPGMAFFPRTGPAGKTCGDCVFRNAERRCAKAQLLAMKKYPPVKISYPACKYFEARP